MTRLGYPEARLVSDVIRADSVDYRHTPLPYTAYKRCRGSL